MKGVAFSSFHVLDLDYQNRYPNHPDCKSTDIFLFLTVICVSQYIHDRILAQNMDIGVDFDPGKKGRTKGSSEVIDACKAPTMNYSNCGFDMQSMWVSSEVGLHCPLFLS